MSQRGVIEMPCPKCGGVNRVHSTHIPETGEMACAYCHEAIAFHTAPKRITGAWNVPGSFAHPEEPAPTRADPALIHVDAGDGGETRGEGLITCPSCGNRFEAADGANPPTTILIVEDTDFFLHLAVDVLGARFRTITARNVAEAREKLATEPVDLLVLDLSLPDDDGKEVLRALPRDMPVLVFTSKDETSLVGREWQMLQALGASDVVHKGLNIEETLLRKVEDLLAARTSA